jgi:serine/threonine-protein kinase
MNLRTRQHFGKYVIERRIANGGYATVYQAKDTIEGVRVALKIPYAHLMKRESIADFRNEVRLAAMMDHPNILPLKYADFIDGQFVIVTLLADTTLQERLKRRMSVGTALDFSRQMLSSIAHAHERRIIHCDIKPENFLIFGENRIRLTDFGIARFAQRTLRGSGAGTVGYIAPEQAMGKPSFRSDVFSMGIVLYRMFSGSLPEWPYQWPLPGYERLRARLHPDFVSLIRKSIETDAQKRFHDARSMLEGFERICYPIQLPVTSKNGSADHAPINGRTIDERRRREFLRDFGKTLETVHSCTFCGGPTAEAMFACPWCGVERPKHRDETPFPAQCRRCYRGLKADWRYCPWCHGHAYEPVANRQYSDRRYSARCGNANCDRKLLMPFMRFCPWCNSRVRRPWTIVGSSDSCARCGWGVLKFYWSYCPWCTSRLKK